MGRITLENRPLPIFPFRPDKNGPKCANGHKDAVSDSDGIAKLFGQCRGAYLIAVPTGEMSGLDVLDIDVSRAGDRWFHENRSRIPTTRTHRTRGGGWHLFFKHSPGLANSRDRIAPGVEKLADGRCVIWWPGHAVRPLVENPIADWPRWLIELAVQPRLENGEDKLEGGGPQMNVADPLHIPKLFYFKVLRLVPLSNTVTRHHQRRVSGILSIVTRHHDLRNNALNHAAFNFRELIEAGIVPREVAESLLVSAAEVSGYVAKDGIKAAIKTIRSGLGSVMSGPPPSFDDAKEGAP